MPSPTPNPQPLSWWRILGFALAVAAAGVVIDEIFGVHIAAWLVGLAVVIYAVWRRKPTNGRPEDTTSPSIRTDPASDAE